MPKRQQKRKGERGRGGRARVRKPAAREKSTNEAALRKHVLYLLRGGGAHVNFEDAIVGLPAELRGVKPAGTPFTAWQLLDHLRIAQWDILEFSTNSKHVSPPWPAGYWPGSEAPPNASAWEKSVSSIRRDLNAFEKLVADPSTDLYRRIPHGQGQTILREALLVADHNSYHLGQIVYLRRLLGAWPAE
jgi:hypothetical protein